MRAGMLVAAAVSLLVASCATARPDTPKQAQVRAALEACRATTGTTLRDIRVSPDGRYTFKSPSASESQAMIDCMRSKGFTAERR
jgi:sugar lactone lactonase YvrE